ncbi:hypothetical protein BCR32DRAFT_276228 [Anaeromyces robustus]|uniref:Uncharacterized protein n=1 Tax=Anaeromyces robustus TaxID=1754192 RepID=A0A1Y1XIG8_9FUNG|nr:hypothetical protein BCR32DRAFT_276228 [Anaeromyces robustus]|eukprot:ORX85558.1 hypothetical protein BCR32DRAFT_276228 [Anaeromyces robustus]
MTLLRGWIFSKKLPGPLTNQNQYNKPETRKSMGIEKIWKNLSWEESENFGDSQFKNFNLKSTKDNICRIESNNIFNNILNFTKLLNKLKLLRRDILQYTQNKLNNIDSYILQYNQENDFMERTHKNSDLCDIKKMGKLHFTMFHFTMLQLAMLDFAMLISQC